MRSKTGFAVFILSLALHALLFFSIPRFHPDSVSKNAAPSTVELVESETQPVNASVRRTSGQPVERTEKAKPLQFAPSFQPRIGATTTGDIDLKPDFTADGDIVDDPAAEWGSGGRQFARVKDLGRFDRLYDMIDAHVMYPSVLAYHQISGTVNARLILTPKGTCDWHTTKIESTESHLRLYVLDVLKRVCKRDLSRFARKSSNSNLDLSFKFAITEHNDEALKDREKKVVGNVFLFYRNSQASIAEWHFGPFRGIFPVPVVALDFVWLQENYDRVMHSRDPLKEFKSHLSEDPPS